MYMHMHVFVQDIYELFLSLHREDMGWCVFS